MLIIRRSKLYYTAYVIITPVGGRPVHLLRADSTLNLCNLNYDEKQLTGKKSFEMFLISVQVL